MGPICYNVCRKKLHLQGSLYAYSRFTESRRSGGNIGVDRLCGESGATGSVFGLLKRLFQFERNDLCLRQAELRWIDPNFNPANYDNIVYHPVTYYPVPKPTTQVGEKALQDILNYTNKELKQAISERKPLATTAGKRSLIFRGAITGVDSSKEGLQFYEVIPVAMIVAGTQAATGHRTMDTDLYFEAEVIDASTNKPVIKVVRKGEGKTLANENTPLTVDTLKQVIDDMAVDAVKFDPSQR